MRRRTPLSLVLCATLLFAAVSTVCAEPDSGGDSWTWSAKSAEENVGKNAGGSSDPAPAEAIPRKSGGFSFPGPQASEKKNKDGIRTIPLNPVSPGIPLVDETTSPSRAKKSQGISPKDVIATVANLQDEDNGITNTNKQINPRRGKSITKALGDPAVNVEARFGKKICKYTGFCKSKSVHPSEVVYVQPVKIQAVGDEIPAIIGTKKGGLHLGGGGLHLGGGGFSSYGPPPVPYYPPSPVQHHHDHHHHHKHKGKKFGYGGGFQAGGFSSSSGGGWAAGPHGVPYARDDNTYYDSVETSGGARVQGGGAQTLNTQLDLSGITGGGASGAGGQQGYAGAPSYSGGPSYASAPAAGPAPAGFSKRGPRQQQYNGGASGKKRRQQAGPAQAAINPQAFQVQAQVAQAQLAQLQQQQFSQYPPQQQPYPVPQQNFASSYPAPLPNVAQNYPPQPAYNPAAFQQPPYIPQPQFQQPPAYLPPSAKSNDCVCVPASSCAPQDVLGRENRPSYQYNQLDPRNKKKPSAESSDSYSELADSLSEDVASYYGDNEARNSKSDAIAALTDAEIKELEKAPAAESRRKRDAPSEQSSDIAVPDLTPAVPESRQLGGGGVCNAYEVCCRNPLPGGSKQSAVNNGQCGVRYARGITGRVKTLKYVDGDAEFGEYPWQAAILKKEGIDNVYICGGSLIDAQHIVTAAHCIKGYSPSDLRIRLGEWDVNHDTEFYTHVEKDVVAVVIHPEFYAGSLYNDIAVLRLDSYVDFSRNPHVSPVCLPNQYSELPAGYRCWTTGWGKDAWGNQGQYQNILKEVDVPLVQQRDCEARLQGTRLGVSFALHEGFLCAGGEQGKDACKGDGGGPLVCDIQGTWQLAGIVSWGIGCGQQDVPGVYVKVSNYLPWIQSVTRSQLG